MDSRLRAIIAIGALVLLFGVQPSWGMDVRSGTVISLPEGSVVADDLVIFGQNINVGAKAPGDLTAFGSGVFLSGTTVQDVMLAGGRIDVTGKVGDDLRAAGGDITISGSVADDASVAGGTVILTSTSRIGSDLQVAGGTIRLEGSIGRNLNAAGGQVVIDGEVGGNVQVKANQLTVGPRAHIKGDLVYAGPKKADIASGAQILGKKIYQPELARRPVVPAFGWFFRIVGFLALFVVGVIIIAISPRAMESTADRVIATPWISLLVGFIILAVVPVAIVIIAATVIGIPLALILLAMYLITIYFSRIFVALAIGRWLFARFGRSGVSPYLGFLVGLVILWLIVMIPYIGWFIKLIAMLLGLGALAAQRYHLVRELRQEGKI